MLPTRTLILSDTAFHADARPRDALLIAAAAIGITAAARVAIPLPFTPVPLTGQTFAVLLIGLALGSRRAGLATALYLAAGMLGLPVFASGTAGVARFTGVTAGYLVAMPFAAMIVGSLAERGWDRSVLPSFAAVLIGSTVILGVGALWLAVWMGSLPGAIVSGLLPFVPAEAVKASVAAALFPSLWRLRDRRV